jgi:hypothetical protein
MPRNVLGEPLECCSTESLRGFYRNGSCNTGREVTDLHIGDVAVVLNGIYLWHFVGTDPAISDADFLASAFCRVR